MTSILDSSLRRPITERLDSIYQQTGYSQYRIFTDWLDFMLASFSLNDDIYLDRVQRYQEDCAASVVDEAVRLYSEALGQLILAVEKTDDDVLGGVYEHYSLTSEQFAQYFTPDSLARGMAAINMPSADAIREASPEDPVTVGDPACGSGRLLLASAKRLRVLSPETPAVFVGQDIDPVCAKMTAITFTLNAISGYAIQGDSLTMDLVGGWCIDPSALLRQEAPVVRCSPDELPVPSSLDLRRAADASENSGAFEDLTPAGMEEPLSTNARSSRSSSDESGQVSLDDL